MPSFDLGTVSVTPGAAEAIARAGEDQSALLDRYRRGDWGDDDPRRRRRNDFAARHSQTVYSLYRLRGGVIILVITSADRSATRVLLPAEFRTCEVSARDGYARWAKSYDSPGNPLIAVEEPRVERLLAGLSFQTVLDAGTGTGRHALRLARRGAAVTALDQSPEMLAVARAAARNQGLTVEFVEASLDGALPFDTGRFDLVVSALVLCHVSGMEGVVGEFHRVLRPGGHLLITDFHPESVAYGWRTTFWDGCAPYNLPNLPYTRDHYLQAVEGAGFNLLTVLDVPLREAPPGYHAPDLVAELGDMNLCLVLLARA